MDVDDLAYVDSFATSAVFTSRNLRDLTVLRRKDPIEEDAHMTFRGLPSSLNKLAFLPHEDLYSFLHRSDLQCRQSEGKYGILYRTLQPLLALRHLTHLHIVSYYLTLRDKDVLALAFAFPRLESLLLRPGFSRRRPLSMTLASVEHAARHLPRLRELGITIDARTCPPAIAPEPPCNRTCATLDVGESPLPAELAGDVARFLTPLFGHPELEITLFTLCDAFDLPWMGTSVSGAAWRDCLERMRQERASGT